MPTTRRSMPATAVLAVTVLLALGACERNPRADAAPGASSATPAPGRNQLAEFAGAQPTYLYDLDFPEEGVVVGRVVARGPLEVVDYDACVPAGPAGAATNAGAPMDRALALLHVSGRGWRRSSTFPLDGAKPASCVGGQACFTLAPDEHLLVEKALAPAGGPTTFHVWQALAAPLVACDPVLFPTRTYPTIIEVQYTARIPLPPATRVSIGHGSSEGITTFACSAGDAASIEAFMQQKLPEYGWQPETIGDVKLWTMPPTSAGAPALHMRIYPIVDPRRWAILEYFPGSNLAAS